MCRHPLQIVMGMGMDMAVNIRVPMGGDMGMDVKKLVSRDSSIVQRQVGPRALVRVNGLERGSLK